MSASLLDGSKVCLIYRMNFFAAGRMWLKMLT